MSKMLCEIVLRKAQGYGLVVQVLVDGGPASETTVLPLGSEFPPAQTPESPAG